MKLFDLLVASLITIYFIIFSVIAVNRYWQYEVHYMDFGIYDETLWKGAHFRTPTVDKGENGRHIFADHFVPGLFLLSPIYWVTDRQEVILVAQVAVVCAAAWVGYTLAKERLKNRFVAGALVVASLGFVGMQNALITEFHIDVFGVLPLMLMFWAIERGRWKWYFLSLVLLLSFKENYAALVVGMGLYLLVRYKKAFAKYAVWTILVGIIWGVGTMGLIIPALNGGTYAYSPSFLQGKSLVEIAGRLVDLKLKRDTLFFTFSTFGFLPLFDVSIWPLLIDHYLERFVLSNDGTRFDMGFHYNAILVPMLFIGAVNVLERLQKRIPGTMLAIASGGLVLWVLIVSRFIYHAPIDLVYNRAFYAQRKNLTYIDDFVKIFPKEGLVLTQNNLAPRLTHGPDIRIIRSHFATLHPDYVILDLTPGQRFVGTDLLAQQIKEYYLHDPGYALTKVHAEQYLFRKKK